MGLQCGGDPHKHELLCLTSKALSGSSSLSNKTRPEVWLEGFADPWTRGVDGKITGLEDTPVPPPQRVKDRDIDGLLPEERALVNEDMYGDIYDEDGEQEEA